jgi:hypothetical protein
MNEQVASFCVVCVANDEQRVKAFPFWEVSESERIDRIAEACAEAAEKFGCSLEVRVVMIAC